MNYKEKTQELKQAILELDKAVYNLRETTPNGRTWNRFLKETEDIMWYGDYPGINQTAFKIRLDGFHNELFLFGEAGIRIENKSGIFSCINQA